MHFNLLGFQFECYYYFIKAITVCVLVPGSLFGITFKLAVMRKIHSSIIKFVTLMNISL